MGNFAKPENAIKRAVRVTMTRAMRATTTTTTRARSSAVWMWGLSNLRLPSVALVRDEGCDDDDEEYRVHVDEDYDGDDESRWD
jgi:hypothetical protein